MATSLSIAVPSITGADSLIKRKSPTNTSIFLTAESSPDASGEVPLRGVAAFLVSVNGDTVGDSTSRRLADAIMRAPSQRRRTASSINAAASPPSADTSRKITVRINEGQNQVRDITPTPTVSSVYRVYCSGIESMVACPICPICAVPTSSADTHRAALDNRFKFVTPLGFPDAKEIILDYAKRYANTLGGNQAPLRDGFVKEYHKFKSKLVDAKFVFVCADETTVDPTASVQRLNAELDVVYGAAWHHLGGNHRIAVAMQP